MKLSLKNEYVVCKQIEQIFEFVRAGRWMAVAAATSIFVFSGFASAQPASGAPQDPATSSSTSTTAVQAPPSEANPGQPAAADANENEDLKKRVEKLEQTVEAVRQENEALTERMDTADEDLMKKETEKERELRIYGFLDVQWYKFLYKDDTFYNGQLNDNNSFTVGHWNLFIEKQLSDHFRVLGEVRFLFQPYGEETGYTSTVTGFAGTFGRVYTKATDWVDAYYFDWGGIAIQRAFIEYKLNDYFGVRAGRFLTPYGVWNVDHASTVVIPAHRPFISTAELMPESQTGLELFGSAMLRGGNFSIDYGLTLANGRGPTTRIYDLDENKAMGANLALRYDGKVSVSAGSYLFMGEYTDITRSLVMNYTTFQIDYLADVVKNYDEKALSFFLKFEGFGVTLQGEFARGIIQYQKGGRPLMMAAANGMPDIYYPDYVQQAAYVLAAYRLPFEVIDLSPYFFYEYQDPSEFAGVPIGHNFVGGLNWRVTPKVVWKVEGMYHKNTGEFSYVKGGKDYGIVTTQLAVSY